ncbi:MAG: gas vesicle protein GvpG [Bacteroidales bacterium]
MFLIDDIVIFIGKKIVELIDRETSDPGVIKERLMELQMKFEMDEINEEEYDKKEKELLELLEKTRPEKQ